MKKYYHIITERNVREIIELNAAQVNTISAAATTTIIDLTAEQPAENSAPDYTALAETIRAELNARHDRSAWDKAVTLYALDLLEDVQEGADNMERLPLDGAELEQ